MINARHINTITTEKGSAPITIAVWIAPVPPEMQLAEGLAATQPGCITNYTVVCGKRIFDRVIYVGVKVLRVALLTCGRAGGFE